MAYNFSSAYINASVSVPTTYPFTMFVRARSTSNSLNQCALSLMVSAGDGYNGSAIYLLGAVAGDPVAFSKFSGGAAVSAGAYSVNTWYAVGGRASSATVHDVSLDGSQTTGPTTTIPFKTITSLQIGGRTTPGLDTPLAGACANVAVWAAVLDDAELVSLAKGFSPRRVRPQSLKYYAPLVRNLNLPVWAVAAATPTLSVVTGTATPSEHPRSYGI